MKTGEVIRYRDDVKVLIGEITLSWKKATKEILFVASKLAELFNDGHGDLATPDSRERWKQVRDYLITEGIMSQPVISQLCRIGSNQILLENADLLPPAYNTIYELSSRTDLEELFRQNLITPYTKLDDVRKMKLIGASTTEDNIEEVEEEKTISAYKTGITIFFKSDDIIHKHSQIEGHIETIKGMMKYAKVEVSGMLRKKIEGD